MIIAIDDPDDPRLEPYRHVRERDLAGRAGVFIAEGKVVLETLLATPGMGPQSLLIAENRVEPLGALLARLPAAVPVYCAPPAILETVAGFSVHRGILALGQRPPAIDPAALLARCGPRALVLALFGIANHDNMGGVFRNAAALGVDAVILDESCCDPLYRKAIRVSVAGTLRVPFARLAPGADAMALLSAAGFSPLALSPRAATALGQMARPARAAVLLGAEGPGLPPAILARARPLCIPMVPGFDSLNVATTSGIVLHYLTHLAPEAEET